jgi:apolipoprotein N-acyltransferase
VFTPAVLRAELPPALPQTPYTRLGDWPGWLAAIAALALALGLIRVPEKRSAAR